jgi:uncharacterized membrane protein
MHHTVSFLLKSFVSRPGVILINLAGLFYCIWCLIGIFPIFTRQLTDVEMHTITTTLNGIAGMFVALGVLYEEREDIMKLAHGEHSTKQHYLNHVAHNDGMGLLVLGLFIEILTISIEIPNKILNTSHIEKGLLIASFIMVALALLIQLSLTIDFLKTYIKKII